MVVAFAFSLVRNASLVTSYPQGLAESESKGADACKCDSVLGPIFWDSFLPAHLGCSGQLLCLFSRISWVEMSRDGSEISVNPASVAKTFFLADHAW